jgi:hypothetical protein
MAIQIRKQETKNVWADLNTNHAASFSSETNDVWRPATG